MSLATFFLLFLLSYQPAKGNSRDFYEWVGKVIHAKCIKNANEEEKKEALEALDKLHEDLRLATPNHELSSEKLYEYCTEKTANHTISLSDSLEKITPCLEPEEKYLQQFLVDGYGNYTYYFCKFISVTGLKKEFRNNCAKKLLHNPKLHPKFVCHNSTKIFTPHPVTVTKELLCSEISEAEPCYRKILDKECPESQESKDIALVMLTQALNNCPKTASNQLN